MGRRHPTAFCVTSLRLAAVSAAIFVLAASLPWGPRASASPEDDCKTERARLASDQRYYDEQLKSIAQQIALAQAPSGNAADDLIARGLAETKSLRQKIKSDEQALERLHQSLEKNLENASFISREMARYDKNSIDYVTARLRQNRAELVDAQKRVDFWEEKQAEAFTGGAVTYKTPPDFIASLQRRHDALQRERNALSGRLAGLRCAESPPASAVPTCSNFTGTWGTNIGDFHLQGGSGTIMQPSGRPGAFEQVGTIAYSVGGSTLTGTITSAPNLMAPNPKPQQIHLALGRGNDWTVGPSDERLVRFHGTYGVSGTESQVRGYCTSNSP
jgi:hypothetical protein